MDEMWSFVGKKEKNRDPDDPADALRGDCWDHVALDAESRLVLSVIPGRRTAENTNRLVEDVKRRLGGRTPDLITTDEYAPYKTAVLETFGETVVPPKTGKAGRPRKPRKAAPPGLNYATVHKTREQGRVVKAERKIVFGTAIAVAAVLAASLASGTINTSFVERHNAGERHRNARKARKTYRFSRDWATHEAMTYLTNCAGNFLCPVATLSVRDAAGSRAPRTPAMAAGLTDHVWTLAEWLKRPAVQRV